MDIIVELVKNDYAKELIVGVITALSVLIIQGLYLYIRNTLNYKKYYGYVGKYHTYRLSETSERVISYNYEVKYKFGKLAVYSKGNVSEYKGYLEITDRNIYIYLSGLEHQERILLVLHKPFTNKFNTLYGVGSMISVLNEPISRVILMTRYELTEDEAFELLNNFTIQSTKHSLAVPMVKEIYTHNYKKTKESPK